jgi:hypothetical protein
MKWRKIAPYYFVSARCNLISIAGYATQVGTKQTQKRTSKMRQFRVDVTLYQTPDNNDKHDNKNSSMKKFKQRNIIILMTVLKDI